MTATHDGLLHGTGQDPYVVDRKTGQKSEAGVVKQRSGFNDSTVPLANLVRLLARAAAREAFEASQVEKDKDTDAP